MEKLVQMQLQIYRNAADNMNTRIIFLKFLKKSIQDQKSDSIPCVY